MTTTDRTPRAPWRPALAAALILAAGPGRGLAQDPRPAAAERREARQIAEALIEFRNAVRAADAAAARPSGLALPPRPEKVVTPPTLTPAELDARIEAALAATGIDGAQLADDEAFLRRASLDVAGTIPPAEEVAAFVRDPDPDKRAKKIDELLAGDAFARNWARYWRDVIRFRATNENLRIVNYPKLEEWLAGQFARNAPWDEVASRLIEATGRNDEDGSVVFTVAHTADPVEVAGEVSRAFLGVQIGCAQCHDHPTDRWTRRQFHEFAAFFQGMRARPVREPGMAAARAVEVVAVGNVRYTMPDLADPNRRIAVAPRFFLDEAAEPLPMTLSAAERRARAASYVTGQDNPWFARAFVNRVWAALMGAGFVTPVDDLGPDREPAAPEVLDALATQWQRGGYDIKWLFRTVLNTRAYQRESRSVESAAGRAPFAANCPSRLRSDQILDALIRALDLPMAGGPAPRRMAAAGAGAGMRGPFDARFLFNFIFGVDPSTPAEDVTGTIPQALFLMNAPQLNRAMRADEPTALARLLQDHPDDAEAVEALYLRVLARRPNRDERAVCADHLRDVGDRREAFEDILWSLINSTEFLSRR